MKKTVTLKGIFDTLEIEVTETSKIPNNAKLFHSVDNYYCYTNHNFIFFRAPGESGRLYPVKCKWSIELELQIKAVI